MAAERAGWSFLLISCMLFAFIMLKMRIILSSRDGIVGIILAWSAHFNVSSENEFHSSALVLSINERFLRFYVIEWYQVEYCYKWMSFLIIIKWENLNIFVLTAFFLNIFDCLVNFNVAMNACGLSTVIYSKSVINN